MPKGKGTYGKKSRSSNKEKVNNLTGVYPPVKIYLSMRFTFY